MWETNKGKRKETIIFSLKNCVSEYKGKQQKREKQTAGLHIC